MAKKGDERTEKELRAEFFEGPASDIMSFEQFLMQQGHGDKIKTINMSGGGSVDMVRGSPEYYKDLL